MARAGSARRYAQAAFQIASENGELDRWMDDLIVLAQAVEDGELASFLDSPQVALARKRRLVESTLGESVSPLALNLISLLASRNVAGILPQVTDQYQRLVDGHRGIERGEVVSAVAMDEEQRRRVQELLQAIIGKEVRLTTRVESGILGGLVARVGDRVIDGSTAAKLEAMRRELVEQLR